MSNFLDTFSPADWQKFCEVMIRQHCGARNFTPIPDKDRGDLGIEFFTSDGTIFQCYYPESGIAMELYKERIQKKINSDLKKLKKNESEIAKLLDGLNINQWVLLTPENKSKDLIAYCNKKKKEVISKSVSFINTNDFVVKIETADSYPAAKLFAQQVYPKPVNIPMQMVTANEKTAWKANNSEFSGNIKRKSTVLMGTDSHKFQDNVVAKYIQIDKLLDRLREDHPDLHQLVEDSARAQLQNIQDNSLFVQALGSAFTKNIVDSNKEAFAKYSNFMNDTNIQSLPFGYLSKWLAECYMDFVEEYKNKDETDN